MIRRPDPSLLDLHDALLFDLDGTLIHGSRPIEHAPEAVQAAREAGRTVVFATNNASRTPQQAADHLAGVGIPAEAAEFVTSPQVATRLLAQDLAPGAVVLVVGSPALAEHVREVGLEPVDTDRDDVQAVVQGFAPDLAWPLLAEGAYAIRRGAAWMATNVDATLPTERGLAPGNGSLVAALRHATGQEPVVAGKPEPGMFQLAARDAAARSPLVIGDRLDTDIEGGVRAGFRTLLVLTGVDDAHTALHADPVRRPDLIVSDLSGLAAPFTLPVVTGDRARCGDVSVHLEGENLRCTDDPANPRVLCAALALLDTTHPDRPWTGELSPDPFPAAA